MRAAYRSAGRLALLALACLGSRLPAAEPPACRLAADGKALQPVAVSATASDRVRRAADTLADYLGRISGARFTVSAGDGRAGVAVGLAADFPALKLNPPWDARDPARREDYLLRSHADGLLVVGASELAVEHAVWDLLYRLGYRQFFPGPTWEVVPRADNPAVAVDAHEHPAYLSRDVGFGYGPWGSRGPAYRDWCARNRMSGAGPDRPLLEGGHAYGKIHADLKAEFDRHPEYLSLVGGKRVADGEVKFCISNPGLRKLVAGYAVDHFTRHPETASLSLEPSDGLGWCECPKCRELGGVSDRVVLLCNEAAAAVRARHGERKLICTYAYAEHAPPPRVRVDPQVVVSVATAMTTGDLTTDELIDGWRRQGAALGVREYYGVFPWDHDLPGQCRLADLGYVRKSIPHFYQRGARFLTAESSDNWGAAGPGYWLMARLLWDPREADRARAVQDDFLDRAFGPARGPAAEFYRLTDAAGTPRLSRDLLGRMYRALAEARKLAGGPAVRQRVDELVLYTRYVELYADYAFADGADRQAGFERLLRFAYRIRPTGMVHSLGVWRGLPYEDRSVRLPPGGGYEAPEGKDPWMDGRPVTPAEVEEILAAGIDKNRPTDIRPVAFGTDLVPATPLALPAVPAGTAGLYFRDRSVFHTWVADPAEPVALTVKGGLIYQNLGDAKLTLSGPGAAAPAGRAAVPPDQKEHAVLLKARAAGLHRVEAADRSAGTSITWPAGRPWVIPAGPGEATAVYGRWDLYFYVPKGTKAVAGYADGTGDLLDGAGTRVLTFARRPDYFSVPVPAGQDGRLWKFANTQGRRLLLTVPPNLARDGRELLLPADVVRADTGK